MKNVYLDSSLMELDVYPWQFKNSLREWLELFPDKITYGSDCFPYNDVMGAEESYWMAVQTESERRNSREKGDYRRWQYGGSFGGPIVQNKIHYFAILADNADYYEIRYDSREMTWQLTRVWMEG